MINKFCLQYIDQYAHNCNNVHYERKCPFGASSITKLRAHQEQGHCKEYNKKLKRERVSKMVDNDVIDMRVIVCYFEGLISADGYCRTLNNGADVILKMTIHYQSEIESILLILQFTFF